jgi:hypothetical protein
MNRLKGLHKLYREYRILGWTFTLTPVPFHLAGIGRHLPGRRSGQAVYGLSVYIPSDG